VRASTAAAILVSLSCAAALHVALVQGGQPAQESPARPPLPPAPAPPGVPKPAAATDGPYAPQPILPGGFVVPLYPPDSPYLRKEKVREAEKYNLSRDVPGRINSIVNIHNPSIEVHLVDRSLNTGSA